MSAVSSRGTSQCIATVTMSRPSQGSESLAQNILQSSSHATRMNTWGNNVVALESTTVTFDRPSLNKQSMSTRSGCSVSSLKIAIFIILTLTLH